jgi:hypothetical protein
MPYKLWFFSKTLLSGISTQTPKIQIKKPQKPLMYQVSEALIIEATTRFELVIAQKT